MAKFFFSGLNWTEGSISLSCDVNGVEPTGCVAASGVLIPVGELRPVNGYNLFCERNSNGLPNIRVLDNQSKIPVPGNSGVTICKDSNGMRKRGSKWVEDSLQYVCGETVAGSSVECKKNANGNVTMNCKNIRDGKGQGHVIMIIVAVPSSLLMQGLEDWIAYQ
ncbi:hypothetical protein KIN20_021886 [Parelaphostrongylus tenuis]|uniref:Uncharacterized protein n=1 Tax=Parelaphostrongylus tenuis TaxID=148309 RepID=A0AAD5MPG8_PARTN|nr:hypothetical protein KIN20_021886 [Parelaphostrongylus tenuis]